MCGFISMLSYLSIFLFLCQYHTLDDCNLVEQSEVREADSSSSIFLSQDCFGYLGGLLCLHTNFKIFCSNSMKNGTGNLIVFAFYLQITLGNTVIFRILLLPIQKHGISFHLFMSSSVFLISILVFRVQVFCPYRQVYSQILYYFLCEVKWDYSLNFSF